MKKAVLGILIIFAPFALFFVYENNQFDSYIHQPPAGNMKIPVNAKAPVLSRNQVEIKAPIETVWKVLTEIQNWPNWQKAVTETEVLGEIREGTRFNWKAGGLSFQSAIHTHVPHSQFGWTGTTLGASAIHNWTFESKDSTTIVKVEESLQGVFPFLFRGYFQKNLDSGMVANLEELKAASEKQ